jgi:hypothetical protein
MRGRHLASACVPLVGKCSSPAWSAPEGCSSVCPLQLLELVLELSHIADGLKC